MSIKLPPLPYAAGALAPHISQQTIEFHYGKHHKAYVDTLNKLIDGADYEGAELEEIVRASAANGDTKIFNNAGQAWNHTFYWNSMTPDAAPPAGDIAAALKRDFGGLDGFAESFAEAGKTQFGSGWAWLIVKDGKLDIRKTANAETPLTEDRATPLLTMDVWEHAYYLDYQNRRPDYISCWIARLANWKFAEANLAKA